jgi:hypothetical protein
MPFRSVEEPNTALPTEAEDATCFAFTLLKVFLPARSTSLEADLEAFRSIIDVVVLIG